MEAVPRVLVVSSPAGDGRSCSARCEKGTGFARNAVQGKSIILSHFEVKDRAPHREVGRSGPRLTNWQSLSRSPRHGVRGLRPQGGVCSEETGLDREVGAKAIHSDIAGRIQFYDPQRIFKSIDAGANGIVCDRDRDLPSAVFRSTQTVSGWCRCQSVSERRGFLRLILIRSAVVSAHASGNRAGIQRRRLHRA